MRTSSASHTATLLLTDIEGSTRLWEDQPGPMMEAIGRHHQIVAEVVARSNGVLPVDQGEGDARFASFESAADALRCALELQRAFVRESWPTGGTISVRIGLHSGDVIERDGNLFGTTVNRCARIRGLAHGGQVLLSLSTYELVRHDVPEGAGLIDMGLHRMKDLIRPERIFQLEHPDIGRDFPPLRSLNLVSHNLPLQVSPLIGREEELSDLRMQLERARLLTLTGPGGTGKTRLAMQVGAEVSDEFMDGVWWVDLAAILAPEDVPQAIATALRLTGAEGQPARDTVLDGLREKETLLLLDNFEHVIDAARLVAELLATCAGVRVLVTSRAPLRIGGEVEYRVEPLEVPSMADVAPHTLDAIDSVRLFVVRARDSDPAFALDTENAASVAEICRRLDGLPLAIELAASRLRLLRPRGLLDRLEAGLGVLTSGKRDAPERQRTLLATIAWSVDLLDEEERDVLIRLAAFRGGFSLEAVEHVCGSDIDVLAAVESLVDKSLVRLETGDGSGDVRFSILETIREFARDMLEERGLTNEVLEAHAGWVLAATDGAQQGLRWGRQRELMRLLDLEHANVAGALDYLIEAGDASAAVRLVHSVQRYWENRGLIDLGLRYVERILQLGDLPDELLCRALLAKGSLTYWWFDGSAVAYLAQSAEVAERAGDLPTAAWALCYVVEVASIAPTLSAEDKAALDEQKAHIQAIGSDPWVAGFLESQRAMRLLHDGDLDAALVAAQRAAAMERESKNFTSLACSEHLTGVIEARRGNLAAARGWIISAEETDRDLGPPANGAAGLQILSQLEVAQGQIGSGADLSSRAAFQLRRLVGFDASCCLAVNATLTARAGSEASPASRRDWRQTYSRISAGSLLEAVLFEALAQVGESPDLPPDVEEGLPRQLIRLLVAAHRRDGAPDLKWLEVLAADDGSTLRMMHDEENSVRCWDGPLTASAECRWAPFRWLAYAHLARADATSWRSEIAAIVPLVTERISPAMPMSCTATVELVWARSAVLDGCETLASVLERADHPAAPTLKDTVGDIRHRSGHLRRLGLQPDTLAYAAPSENAAVEHVWDLAGYVADLISS